MEEHSGSDNESIMPGKDKKPINIKQGFLTGGPWTLRRSVESNSEVHKVGVRFLKLPKYKFISNYSMVFIDKGLSTGCIQGSEMLDSICHYISL
ncbi:Hypothetical protein CINCED_3A020633 [Cinara cedri]|uniref:Uncharacterized protein n=1 Tax=Cinara cedri TaxID=506608 RepID=A0A5E4NKI4_9HEMI|nr:Hypothetical protein CINCED_3A020633 [Cinara cedri]